MTTRMLIDAAHPEETRVVVVKGNRIEEFDFESAAKKQLKGNIYLAKVTRVEPSLQAAFVEYGGNRHGFLAFNEIHPDYYQIPVEDRQRLLEAEMAAQAAAADEEEAEAEARAERHGQRGDDATTVEDDEDDEDEAEEAIVETVDTSEEVHSIGGGEPDEQAREAGGATPRSIAEAATPAPSVSTEPEPAPWSAESAASAVPAPVPADGEEQPAVEARETTETEDRPRRGDRRGQRQRGRRRRDGENGDDNRARQRVVRPYKIQEVIKRRQILLVQVVKEERGNKGAALTTYLSLAGRYCVLMPNTARGGGISRKIVNQAARKKLKEAIGEFDVAAGMGVIIRTAGMNRTKQELRRDYEYLLRLWDGIREFTLQSTAPALIYEEADLIKRSIRDLYSKDIDEVLVEGDQGYKTAHDFMSMLLPSQADRVQPYTSRLPLFHAHKVEQQLDTVHSPTVQLRSGGYIVINQTEALVAIDVNSGRSTREHNIEETALRTNLEAAEEVARQLRLRDLAGLVVIDFIDMERSGNDRAVERRLKDALKADRARIQMGRISPFGLLELSRQRLRPSLFESSMTLCPHCTGVGFIRSTESAALHVLRAVEEEGLKDRAAEVTVHVPTDVALYLLNNKRQAIHDIENDYAMRVLITADEALVPPNFRLDRMKTREPRPEGEREVEHAELPLPSRQPIRSESAVMARYDEPDEEDEPEEAETAEAAEAPRGEVSEAGEARGDDGRRRRRRRRRRRGDDERAPQAAEGSEAPARNDDFDIPEPGAAPAAGEQRPEGESNGAQHAEDGERRHRRGRRGRRRGRHDGNGHDQPSPFAQPQAWVEIPIGVAASAEPPAPVMAWSERPLVVPSEQPVAAAPPPPMPEPAPVAAPTGAAPQSVPEPAAAPEPAPEPPPAAPPAYEVLSVDAPPEQRRRGWWKR
jgi:ribonuclease E